MNENKCGKCGGDMVVRKGATGQFLGCNNFPACKNTMTMPKDDLQAPVVNIADKAPKDTYESDEYQIKSRDVRARALHIAQKYSSNLIYVDELTNIDKIKVLIGLARELELYIRKG